MTAKPHVNVLTLYHNREKHVDLSLRSLLDQGYDNLKIVAVDDGSTDGTLHKLRALECQNLEVRTQENKGFTRSLIDTLDTLDADFVAIHGSGDISHPQRIERQVEALLADADAAFCCTGSRTVDAASGRQFDKKTFVKSRVELADVQHAPPFTHGTVMLRMARYRAAGGYDPFFEFASDWDLWARMLRDRHGVYIQDILYDQLAQEDGATFSAAKSVKQIRYNLIIQEKLGMNAEEAEAFMREIRLRSLDDILPMDSGRVIHAAFRRAVKLVLMGRRSAAAEILELSSAQARLGIRERLALRAASIISALPAGPSIGTALARALK